MARHEYPSLIASLKDTSTWLAMFGVSGMTAFMVSAGCSSSEYQSAKNGAGGETSTVSVEQTTAPITGSAGAANLNGGAPGTTGQATSGGATDTLTNAQGGTAVVTTTAAILGGAGGAATTAPATASGGVAAIGGTSAGVAGAATGGAATGSTIFDQCVGVNGVTGSAYRPQLTDEGATRFGIAQYLARGGSTDSPVQDDWNPTGGLGDPTTFVPTYTVAADGSGTHVSVQAAINDATATSATSRAYILVKPGTYREVLCLTGTTRPITIYGNGVDASAVRLTFDSNEGKKKDADVNPCFPLAETATTYGIPGSTTFANNTDELQLYNLTVANDFAEGSDPWAAGQQAVAFLNQGDRVILENVRIIGNHYTAAFESRTATSIARIYLKKSFISGDMQYIVGRGTAVLDDTEIHFITTRLKSPLGSIMAASTAAQNPFGFLVINSRLSVEANSGFDWVLLGRSWDVDTTIYNQGVSPNGQIVVRNTYIDSHINKNKPWGNALVTARLFDCRVNRLYEYSNTGPGAVTPPTSTP